MTKREKVVVSAYTGILMTDIADVQAYASELFGRPIFTHEMGSQEFCSEFAKLAKPEFMKICEEEM